MTLWCKTKVEVLWVTTLKLNFMWTLNSVTVNYLQKDRIQKNITFRNLNLLVTVLTTLRFDRCIAVAITATVLHRHKLRRQLKHFHSLQQLSKKKLVVKSPLLPPPSISQSCCRRHRCLHPLLPLHYPGACQQWYWN